MQGLFFENQGLLILLIKFFWDTAESICSHIAYGCFHDTIAELSSCNRKHMAWKAKNIYHLALYTKSFLTPDLDQTD